MEESYQDRQENEKSSLQAIYGNQIDILSPTNEEWKPLECILTLSTNCKIEKNTMPIVQLHIVCPSMYPDCVPEIYYSSIKGLSAEKSVVLLRELCDLSKKLVGEVMIFELAQHTEKFLHQNRLPGYESFYEEMITRNKTQEELELQKKQLVESKKREEIINEIYSQKQAVKKALRRQKHSGGSEFENDSPVASLIDKCHHVTFVKNIETEKSQDVNSSRGKFDEDWKMNFEEFSPLNRGQSRFEHEFEHIKWLGRGAFGDVLKVRNKLDDGLYAVKRIPLNPINKQLNRRITREVKLLSRLNHENVVRYYNSWIESVELTPVTNSSSASSSPKKQSIASSLVSMLPRNEALSVDWNDQINNDSCNNCDDGDDDSWISFRVNSDEDVFGETSVSSADEVDGSSKPINSLTYMYIQMELCEKNTLRSAIDNNLFTDLNRVWRLFREIIEGLSHIHQQGIIHRDLKPVNIFIGHGDRVKIGDFGLATTIILQKQSVPRDFVMENPIVPKSDNGCINPVGDTSHTGQVGSALYVAPELEESDSKVSYNQKVDIYSLGVIFFEMCHPPWKTKMEQLKVISNLREKAIIFPNSFPHPENSHQHYLIRWMMKHNVKERPTSNELLCSEHIPPPQLEEAEMKDMVRRTLSNPQSKDYKYLIESCFKQVMPAAIDATFDISSGHSCRFMLYLESITKVFREVFTRHGAISLIPPLLTPQGEVSETSVTLMTRWGGTVNATLDLRTPFARYLAKNPSISHLKRYIIDKVYRERRVYGLHPKEVFECAFDIVSPTPESLLPETEMIFVMWEIMSKFPSILSKNCSFRLNHSSIIAAILKHCGLEILDSAGNPVPYFKVKNEFDSRVDIQVLVESRDIADHIKNALLNILTIEGNIEDVKSQLLTYIKDEALVSQCNYGFNQLQIVLNYAKTFGINIPVYISLSVVQNAHHFSGLICQLVIEQKNRLKSLEKNVLINGGRYDQLIKMYRQLQLPNKAPVQCGVGLTISVDKFISCLNDQKRPAVFDVMIWTTNESNTTPDKLFIIRDLWKQGVRTFITNTTESLERLQDYCQEFGIPHIVILKDSDAKGIARVRSWNKEKFNERKIHLNELVDFLSKAAKNLSNEPTIQAKVESKSSGNIGNANISFISIEKISLSSRRRYETQIKNSLSGLCEKFSNKARLEVYGLFLESNALKSLCNCIETSSPDQEMKTVMKKHPSHKKYISKILDQVGVRRGERSSVLILYSLIDNMFKVIL